MEEGFLSKIIASKQKELEQSRIKLPQDEVINLLQSIARDGKLKNHSLSKRNFASAINIPNKISLIAEIKKASPSKGILREDFNLVKIAEDYQSAGASAVSVLTDEVFFGGDVSFVGKVKEAVPMPVLRKDFIIDEYQIYQSALIEADCVLLIADILKKEEILNLLSIAKLLNIEVLVESNTQEALEKTLSSGAQLVGINNRDLNNFEVDIKTTERLIGQIPKDRIIISESGIKTPLDVNFLKSLGVNAVLIGEVFMQAQDIPSKVKEVMGW